MPLYARKTLEGDMLLAGYIAYRAEVGEPVSSAELLQVAKIAETLGFASRTVAEVMRALAQGAPTPDGLPSRPARNGVPDPASSGLFEAHYWEQRLTREGRQDAAKPFSRRLGQLISEMNTPSG